MNVDVRELALGVDYDGISTSSANFRPPSWPPPRDWPVCIDKSGNVISCWGDPIWDLTPMSGTLFSLNFGDGRSGQAERLDRDNADLLRLAMTWIMWGPRSAKTTATIQIQFTMIRAVIAICSRNRINAATLSRYPRVLEQVPSVVAPSRYGSTISVFHRLHDARSILGFDILDARCLKRLAEVQPDHQVKQTPYIPPRIWLYQLERLRECIDDFLAHEKKLVACFEYCSAAYRKNYGSLAATVDPDRDFEKAPFNHNCTNYRSSVYLGKFADTAGRFGLGELLSKWLGDRKQTVGALSAYMSMVSLAGTMYIANFTLQRKEEAASLRSDCLKWEEDEKLGRVLLVVGETTKTIRDSDARWVASPSVEHAVRALTVISRLRMTFDKGSGEVNPSRADQSNPFLHSAPTEPWGSGKRRAYGVRAEISSIKEVMRDYPSLFDKEKLRITSDDLKLARRITPSLDDDEYRVGNVWTLAWHQLRRTAAVNMFASGLISDSTMQMQMKHASRLMPLYYGRNYTRLLLNEEVESIVITAMYAAMTERLKIAITGRFLLPQSEVSAVKLISVTDGKKLLAWAKEGKVSFREHRLGGCMKTGPCEYGGVESVARCGGGDGQKPCADVVFDRERKPDVLEDLADVKKQIARLPAGSPRRNALNAESRAMRNYLDAVEAD